MGWVDPTCPVLCCHGSTPPDTGCRTLGMSGPAVGGAHQVAAGLHFLFDLVVVRCLGNNHQCRWYPYDGPCMHDKGKFQRDSPGHS